MHRIAPGGEDNGYRRGHRLCCERGNAVRGDNGRPSAYHIGDDTGQAIGTEMVRYGQRVTVIVLPAPEIFLSPRGLQLVGPRAFGYDIDFRSALAS